MLFNYLIFLEEKILFVLADYIFELQFLNNFYVLP